MRRGSPRLPARTGPCTATPETGALMQSLPAELLAIVAREVIAAGKPLWIAHMARTCRAFRPACLSDAAWEPEANRRFPRLRAVLQLMPPPRPPYHVLFRNQWRAEPPTLRPRLPSLTRRDDFVYSVEIYNEDLLEREPVATACGRLHFFNDSLQLWEDGAAPAWAESIVHDFRESSRRAEQGIPSPKFFDTPGGRVVRSLRAVCYVTHPDHSTFRLYDGRLVASKHTGISGAMIAGHVPGIHDEFDEDDEDDEDDGHDLFEMDFREGALPTRCAPEEHATPGPGCKATVFLQLRGTSNEQKSSDEAGPCGDAGRVEVRYLSPDLAAGHGIDQDMEDEHVVYYLENFAPFRR